MQTVMITGASSGIGWDTTRALIEAGFRVIAVVRKTSDSEKLKSSFSHKVIPLLIELDRFEQIDQIPQILKSQFQIEQIDILVNNAGMALAGPFQDQNFIEIENIIRVNVLSVMKLTQVMLPLLKKSTNAKIINISSISGVSGAPFLSAYAASKHAIEGFSKSLRKEMMMFGIQVVVIGPGSIKTPIWNKGFQLIRDYYKNSVFAESFQKFIAFAANEEANALEVSDISKLILKVIRSNKPLFRYAPIPRKWMNWYLPGLIPDRIYNKLTAKALGLRSSSSDN